MPGTPLNPVILQELSDKSFDKGVIETGLVNIKIDPTSNIAASLSSTGVKLSVTGATLSGVTTNALATSGVTLTSTVNTIAAPVDLTSAVNAVIASPSGTAAVVAANPHPGLTATFDPLANTITIVHGTSTQVMNLGKLDDEGVKLALTGGNLQLLNAAGVVLSTIPLTGIDMQQLSISGNVITLSNGGNVTLPPNSVTSALSVTGNGLAANPLQFVGDVSAPGNFFYYGTDATGSKSYYSFAQSMAGAVPAPTSAVTAAGLVITSNGVAGPALSLTQIASAFGTPLFKAFP